MLPKMEFTVEYYETANGNCPVEVFLDKLIATDPGDAAAVFAGLNKLKQKTNHHEVLSKAIGDGLLELRHVGKLNTRVLWFFTKGKRIIAVHGILNKGQKIAKQDRDIAKTRMKDWIQRNAHT